jgi:hypothetical protein
MTDTLTIERLVARSAGPRRVDFFAELPCPMKQRFRDAYDAFEGKYFRETGRRLYSFVPTNCPDHVEKTMSIRDLGAAASIADIPDLTICYAFDAFSRRSFIEGFIKPGYFEKVLDTSGLGFINPEEFEDPYGAFNSIGFFSQIILVDRNRLRGRPVPVSLESLMDETYEKSIVIPSLQDDISTMLLHHIYQRYGEAGLDRIERNIHGTLGGITAARTAGTGDSEAAIYLVPWVFAQGAVKQGHTELVWPAEGALVEPLILMAKKERREEAGALLDFLKSAEVAEIFSENHFISTNPAADSRIPPGGKITWLGWNYVYHNDIEAIQTMLTGRFNKFL